jgi:hypothetical protein
MQSCVAGRWLGEIGQRSTKGVTEKAGIQNNLAVQRQKRGLAAAHLAKLAGVSRQTVYAMEAGRILTLLESRRCWMS